MASVQALVEALVDNFPTYFDVYQSSQRTLIFATSRDKDARGMLALLLPVFDRVLSALRDVDQNPEWRFVEEGAMWRGKRVLRW